MIKLIASDMDGTLLEAGGNLPEDFFDIARQLKNKGITLAAASGRQFDNLRRLFQPIAGEMCYICENGAVNAVGREIISIRPMERSVVMEIIRMLQNFGLTVLLSGARAHYITPDNRPFCDQMVYQLRNTIAVVESFDLVDDEMIKVSAYCEGGIEPYVERLEQKWGARVQAARSGAQWFDFNTSNKGMGLRDLMAKLALRPEETVAFGDNFNDESMFKRVGHPFVMEKADVRLRKPGVRVCEKVMPILKAILAADGQLPETIG